jgi:membrane protein implicated in regulation of membrane protease activity
MGMASVVSGRPVRTCVFSEGVAIVGPGLFLLVLGALLTFAVKDDVPGINLGVAGLILMIAGGAVIAHARATAQKERVVERHEESSDPDTPTHVVREIEKQRRTD